MISSCLFLLATVFAQNNVPPTTFKFYVTPSIGTSNLNPFQVVDSATTKEITFKWSWDNTCAGVTDDSRPPKPVANPKKVGNECVDQNGRKTFPATANVFPKGLDTFVLQRGFNSSTPPISIMPPSNNGAFAGSIDGFKLTGLDQMASDYYTLSMSATDALGNNVKGGSITFAIKARGEIPVPNSIRLVSPLPGSYWLSNAKYRVRFGVLPTGFIPDAFNLDILDKDGNLLETIQTAQRPLAGDDLLGTEPASLLNYTVWTIDKKYTNTNLRVKLTGVGLDNQGKVISMPQTPSVTSGLFFIGRAASEPPK
ncbi:hypothetical protein BC833DRAFT_581261 [Globomyces pollinis-pini]|nr:hypothetical protein BC833DRAFT_581261 [Globomyces pollinis-pini]